MRTSKLNLNHLNEKLNATSLERLKTAQKLHLTDNVWERSASRAAHLVNTAKSMESVNNLESCLLSLQNYLLIIFSGSVGFRGDQAIAKEAVLFNKEIDLYRNIENLKSAIFRFRETTESRKAKVGELFDSISDLLEMLKTVTEERQSLSDIDEEGMDITLSSGSRVDERRILEAQQMAFGLFSDIDLFLSEMEGDVASEEIIESRPLGIPVEDPEEVVVDVESFPSRYNLEEGEFKFPALFKEKKVLSSSTDRLNYFKKLARGL